MDIKLAINGFFYDRPDTGSGQYLLELLAHMPPGVETILVLPAEYSIPNTEYASRLTPHVSRPPIAQKNLAKVWFEQIAFPRACRELKADLAHVPYWAPPFSSSVPFVVTIHDIMPLLLPEYRDTLQMRAYFSLVSATTHGAAHVIADSEASRNDILDHFHLAPEKVTAIPLAVGPQYQPGPDSALDAAARRKYDLPDSYVLYIGGFHPRKNVRNLLAAWTWAAGPIGENYPLVIAGKLPKAGERYFEDLLGYAAQLGIADTVRFIGIIEEADKPSVYRGAACFVYPSCYEGFGLPPLEAMACGVPVVTTAFSSIPEVVGDAAYLVRDPDDTRLLGAAIIAVVVEPSVSDSLIEKGQAQAKKFSWERAARETVEVYRNVLSSG